MSNKMLVTTCGLAATLLTSTLFAGDPASHASAMPGEAEQMAMMQKYMDAATPGPMHALLTASTGTWDLKVTSWMAPGAPPQTSTGTAERRSVFGGRFVIEEVSGEAMFPGMPPMQGMGINGYDNVSKQFVSTWMDNMGTGLMVSTGTYDPETKTVSYVGSYNDPVFGRKTLRMLLKHVDDAHVVFEMYDKGPDGAEFKNMQIDYMRK